MDVRIGCDPELFVRDKTTQTFVCAEGLIPGEKRDPFKVEHGAVQVDGTAVEFNIDPASTRVEFVGNVCRVYDQLSKMVKAKNENYELVPTPIAHFEKKYFTTLSKKALELGCDPDWNAYTGEPNPAPDPGKGMFRTASGHVHVGWMDGDNDPKNPDYIRLCCDIVKQLDWFVGYPSLWFGDCREESGRRKLYGKAGCFRPKVYGLEYRTPSNTWLRDPKLIRYVYDQTKAAIDSYKDGYYLPDRSNSFNLKHCLDESIRYEYYFHSFNVPKPPKI